MIKRALAQRLDTLESENQLLHARVAELEAARSATVCVEVERDAGAAVVIDLTARGRSIVSN
jgi:hypothetical protein